MLPHGHLQPLPKPHHRALHRPSLPNHKYHHRRSPKLSSCRPQIHSPSWVLRPTSPPKSASPSKPCSHEAMTQHPSLLRRRRN
ncbi:hypothetical protein P153DRAFT_401406 [Dothidotthia symphoricarpi CBS 119687]|uniref:Uncharacterized protein n=1 Tax=Dothidotthia symphoricarpi CBS 119687 TaxID=1392245 RepID=A0A6A5ZVR6_9PLEO|nr:uncharacterized protein P153DRAFT_401406 [Dothidotthia symphoricarpi CBS 119687]KAF2123832.1 hypothetical protein P153DRAFT_401406 [Dothidotthia symphoricarpi CBS 119687]